MTHNNNIEQQLSELKKHYKVPENYFENLHVETDKLNKKRHLSFSIKAWLVAASVILLVSLGYNTFNRTQKPAKTPVIVPKQIAQNDNLFDDLTDDEIIDYLVDENLVDQFN